MAASMNPYPPSQSRPAHQISPQDALSSLSAFLSASESTPYLHPDARIAPDEIKYSTNGGPQGGIVLHHLRRIEKGLKGEILAPEPDDIFDLPEGDDATLDESAAGFQASLEGGKRKGGLKKTAEEQEGWQDMESYQRSQTIVEGDVGERDTSNGYQPDFDADGMDIDSTPATTTIDKDARKEAKKNKRKAEQKEKAEAKKKAKG